MSYHLKHEGRETAPEWLSVDTPVSSKRIINRKLVFHALSSPSTLSCCLLFCLVFVFVLVLVVSSLLVLLNVLLLFVLIHLFLFNVEVYTLNCRRYNANWLCYNFIKPCTFFMKKGVIVLTATSSEGDLNRQPICPVLLAYNHRTASSEKSDGRLPNLSSLFFVSLWSKEWDQFNREITLRYFTDNVRNCWFDLILPLPYVWGSMRAGWIIEGVQRTRIWEESYQF